MPFGLFGKVPQKRDFLAVNLPDAILHPFEKWLQTSLAASREVIGRRWEEYYLVAPIWRFWIGSEVFGAGCAGAMAPSVDAVGRYFPLALVHWSGTDAGVPPPLLAPHEEWYARLDARLLQALSETHPGYLASLLDGLEAPAAPGLDKAEPPSSRGIFRRGTVLHPGAGESGLEVAASRVRERDYLDAATGRSYWWCNASAVGGAILHAGNGLPDPQRFANLLKR